MKYAEMLNSPFTIFDTPSGIVACSRDLDQLPVVVKAINNSGLLLGRPETIDRMPKKYQGLWLRDVEGVPSTLLLRSVNPRRKKYERVKSLNQRLLLWPDVPGSIKLWDLLNEDEMRLLKFTLNCQKWLTNNKEDKSDGFAAYSAALVAYLGDSL